MNEQIDTQFALIVSLILWALFIFFVVRELRSRAVEEKAERQRRMAEKAEYDQLVDIHAFDPVLLFNEKEEVKK